MSTSDYGSNGAPGSSAQTMEHGGSFSGVGSRRVGSMPASIAIGGEEAIRILRGEIRFRIGDEQRICRAGEIAFIPANVEHGFEVLSDDTLLEAISEQAMGQWMTVLDADNRRDDVEVYVEAYPWCHDPPPGVAHTTRDELLELARRTRHLI